MGEGFFSENFKTLLKAQKNIENVVDVINRDQNENAKQFKKRKLALDKMLKEL